MKICLIQLNASSNKTENLEKTQLLLERAIEKKPDLICLPEVFNLRSDKKTSIDEAESIETGLSTLVLKDFAKTHKVWISNGSIFEKQEGELPFNSSIMINNNGEIVGKYRKNHLFKVCTDSHEVDEAKKSQACTKTCLVNFEKNSETQNLKIKIGLSICYDLRFPELYRNYAKEKAEIILVPSSFAKVTGEAHWQTLLQARAIENQCYVVAANQWGISNGLETYGNSMVVGPWGRIIAQASFDEDEIVFVDLDMNYLHKVRKQLPALEHMKK